MLDTFIIGGITGVGIIFLVFGMGNFIKIFKKRKELNLSLIMSIKNVMGKNILSWLSFFVFILFIIMIILGIIIPVIVDVFK